MKHWLTLLLAIAISSQLSAAENAACRMHCLSLIFQPASASLLGLNYTVTLGTGPGQGTDSNNELAPLFGNGPASHGSRFTLQSDVLFEPISGNFYLDVPPAADANTNQIGDFFEVDMPVSASTTGTFVDDFSGEQGTIRATWNRAAGSPSGTCQLQMSSSYLQGTFVHSFSLWEYDGLLQYTPASGSVTGWVSLADSLPASNILSGQITLIKLDQDNLTLSPGTWTNGNALAWPYFEPSRDTLSRLGTNYVAFLVSTNGDPANNLAGYGSWLFYIGDANDANLNGVPDLSDSASAPVNAPNIAIVRNAGQLSLNIQGEVGQTFQLEQIDDLGQKNWAAVASIAITNSPMNYELPTPGNATRFWRLRSP